MLKGGVPAGFPISVTWRSTAPSGVKPTRSMGGFAGAKSTVGSVLSCTSADVTFQGSTSCSPVATESSPQVTKRPPSDRCATVYPSMPALQWRADSREETGEPGARHRLCEPSDADAPDHPRGAR